MYQLYIYINILTNFWINESIFIRLLDKRFGIKLLTTRSSSYILSEVCQAKSFWSLNLIFFFLPDINFRVN